ncbi:MAG: serine/threonine-protein phosphatase [Limnobacter sp.]|nr:serine/threonine-protein phosphatase [Limnobacter sp.]
MKEDDSTIQLDVPRHPVALACVGKTHQGGRAENQDALGWWEDENWFCAAVADGAGGHEGGALAASLAVHTLLEGFRALRSLDATALRQLALQANAGILAEQGKCGLGGNMFSTVVFVAIQKITWQVRWLHAGDSRLYWFCQSGLKGQTQDHAVQITQSAGKNQPPARSHQLFSALGQPPENLLVDVLDRNHFLVARDRLLLCTDGFWDSFSSRELTEKIGYPNPVVCDQYCNTLLAESLQRAGSKSDNLTFVVVSLS